MQDFVGTGCYIGTSHIGKAEGWSKRRELTCLGNRQEMEAMLKLASEKGIKSWVETIKISANGCTEAVERVKNGDVRYRFTLVGYDEVFGKR
jgi:alcohol dehydrogenase (NADP+)